MAESRIPRIAACMLPADTIRIMRIPTIVRIIVLTAALLVACGWRIDDKPLARGEVFENVVKVLRTGFYDEAFRQTIPQLAERYREEARAAATLNDERDVIGKMLGEIPASHLGVLSAASHEQMTRNLTGEPSPTFGFELTEFDGEFFASSVLERGPAARAGIRRGDRVLLIDGQDPERSPRLDWRSDDAALPDPPTHAIIANGEGDPLSLEIERTKGNRERITFAAARDSAYEAAKRSAEVVEMDGQRIAYIHFWFIHMRGMDKLLERLIANEFKDAEALVLDLRGRGGSAEMVTRVLRVLASRNSKWKRPIVALVDNQTRSAKEMMAYELKTRKLGVLVGQRTAGALLPATFADVGGDTVLMYPAFALRKYSDAVEGKGVEADIEVESPLPLSNGADPIRDTGMLKAAEMAKTHARSKQPA